MDINNLTSQEVAAFFEAALRTVQDWPAKGCPHHLEGKDLRFDLKKTHKWWLTHQYRAPKAFEDGSPTEAASKARILEVKAKREARDFAKEEGELIEAHRVEEAWTRMFLACRTRLLNIPDQLRGPLGTEVANRVEEGVRIALTELSKGGLGRDHA